MRYLSLFSGVEAASLAWEPLGWVPVAFAEIELFPSAVLAERWPKVPNLGDVTRVDWSAYRGSVDVVVGGSPCQAFSVAGRRLGLMDGRGGLMLEYVRAVAEARPRWFVWENVPGVLSQDGGRAFGTLLREMDELGYGMSWRVLDAQFFGVAQRRRRVFLVGHLGDWGASAAVLFESESVRGNTKTSREKRQELTRAVGRGASGGGSAGFCGYASHTAASIGYADEMAPTLKGNDWQNQVPDVLHSMAVRTAQTGANGCGISEEVAHTVDTTGPEAVAYATRMREGKAGGGEGPLIQTDVSGTVATGNDQNILCGVDQSDMSVTINDGSAWVVRRLTPTECERLQGFPEGWTDIGDWVDSKGKKRKCSDGNRYKAIGNSMAVPVMRWIGERMQAVDRISVRGKGE